MPLPPAIGRLNKLGLNRLTVKLAGRGPFGELEHVGRRSGRSHRVPIMAFGPDSGSGPDGAVPVITFALTYGPKVDWLCNARAAGGALDKAVTSVANRGSQKVKADCSGFSGHGHDAVTPDV